MNIDDIEEWPVDGTVKGMPPGSLPIRVRDIGAQGWNLLRRDLPFPVATLSRTALENNQRWMSAFLDHSGVRLAPHGKTTMAPQLFALQLEAGCWGITVATVQQLAVCRRYGVNRVLMANQLTSPSAVDYVLGELDRDAGFEFYCLVDSVAGVKRLVEHCRNRRGRRPLNVLLEIGLQDGRTGSRTTSEAMTVARTVAEDNNGLALAGVETYEGLLVTDDAAQDEKAVRALLARVLDVVRRCQTEGLLERNPALLSAGGSAYYDIVADRLGSAGDDGGFEVVVRSGCYLTHDSVLYRHLFDRVQQRVPGLHGVSGRLIPALTVWSEVQSRPEPDLAILTMGRRDASSDAGLPTPCWHVGRHSESVHPIRGAEVFGLNDQHAYLRLPKQAGIDVGDLIGCGISHPCTTFDKWDLLFIVDDDWSVSGAVKTFF